MGSLLLVVFLAGGAYLWVRTLRRSRVAWLRRVNLPGTWEAEHDDGATLLELTGDVDGGAFSETRAGGTQTGRWRVTGHSVVFETTGGESVCELRIFGDDRIGLHGQTRERQVYRRRQSNVVPLRRDSG